MSTTEREPLGLPPGDVDDDALDWGSAADIDDGESLVLRRAAGQSGGGLPTTGTSPERASLTEPEGNIIRRFITAFKSYSELRRTPYGYAPVLIIAGLIFFNRFSLISWSIAGPFVVRDLEIDIRDLIGLLAFIGVVLLVVNLPLGWWLDRHKRAPWVGLGAMAGAVASMVGTRGRSFFAFGAPRVAEDVLSEASGTPRFSLLADYYPPEVRGKVFSLLSTFRRAGQFTAVFAAGLAINRWGWRTSVFIFAIPLFLMGVYALVRLREPRRGYMERRALGATDDEARQEDDPVSFAEGWRTTFKVRTLRRLFIAECFTSAQDNIVALFLPFYAVETYNLDAFELSMVFLPGVFLGIFGGIYGGSLIDRFTRRSPGRVLSVFGVYILISQVGTAGFGWKTPLFLLVVFNSMLGFGSSLIGPATSVVYAQVIPANLRTQALQVTALAQIPGLLLGEQLASAIYGEYGYHSVFLATIPLGIIGAFVAMSAGSFFDLDVRSAFAASLADQEWRKAKERGQGKMLVCRDLEVGYSGVQVLFNVDFDVEEGEIIALLGTNGAGKSTLLRAISGSTEATSGAVVFDGRDITHMPPHEVAARGVVHMPGGRGIFPGLSVRDNLMLANWMTEEQEEIHRRLTEVFEIFPSLVERLDARAGDLSGGEQQQLSLAQAFLSRPRLLMIDELSLGLSPAVVGQLLEIVREIHRRGVTIIVVEQSVNVALTIADKAVFMEKGEVRFFGRTADLLERPDILRAVYVKGTGALTDGAPASARRSERQQRDLSLAEARPVLEVDGLVKKYGGITAVDHVSFALREGEVLGLIGPNGAGKTTIFDLISGFQPVDEGRVIYQGVDVTTMSPEERARKGLVRRFQDARLFPALTVYETLLVALEQKNEAKNTIVHALGLPQGRASERRLRARADRLIELLELTSYRDKFVKELSTGLRRIADLACVLASEPSVLLLDEPSSGIAQAETEALAPLLRRIRYETGCSILIIEHDMPLISAVSDELIAFDRGAFVLRGKPDVVLNDERVIESYLGTTEAAVKRSGSTV